MKSMKSILISIKPESAVKILNGEKTIEIQETAPECELPIDVYIYCTKDGDVLYTNVLTNNFYLNLREDHIAPGVERRNGEVVAKFTLRNIEEVERYTSYNFGVTDRFWEEYGTVNLTEGELLKLSCLEKTEIGQYLKWDDSDCARGFAWFISDLVIFDKPKPLYKFEKPGSYGNPTIKCKSKEQGRCNYGRSPFTGKWIGCDKARLTEAPQSWCYIEGLKNDTERNL